MIVPYDKTHVQSVGRKQSFKVPQQAVHVVTTVLQSTAFHLVSRVALGGEVLGMLFHEHRHFTQLSSHFRPTSQGSVYFAVFCYYYYYYYYYYYCPSARCATAANSVCNQLDIFRRQIVTLSQM